ncbi:hypothetical protein MCEMSEM23_00525 [Rhabdaerophilaceae bacterium]
MKSVLSLAIVVVTILLVAFAERLGLPGGLASWLVISALAIFVVGLSLLSATSRLSIFLDGDEQAGWVGQIALQVSLLAGALTLLEASHLRDPAAGLALVAGYLAAVTIAPARCAFQVRAQPDRMMSGLDTAGMFGLATSAAAVLLMVVFFRPFVALLSDRVGESEVLVRAYGLDIVGMIGILGGYAGLSRLSRGVLVLVLLFIVLPLLSDGLARGVSSLFDLPIRGDAASLLAGATEMLSTQSDLSIPAVTGLCLGLVGLVFMPGQRSLKGRLGIALPALIIVGGMAALLLREIWALERFMTASIFTAPPSEWPLFVFDETLRGWMKVCGLSPRDAMDVLRSCGLTGPREIVAAARVELSQHLFGPAMAGMRGWPVLFGYVWGLLGPLVALCTICALLHAFATGLTESLLFRFARPNLLRSGRLVSARAVILSTVIGLAWGHAHLPETEAHFARFVTLSALFLASMSLLASWVLEVRRWLAQRAARHRLKPDGATAMAPTTSP